MFPGGIEELARMVREVPNEVVNLMGRLRGARRVDADLLDEVLDPRDRPAMPGDLNAGNIPGNMGIEGMASEEEERQYGDDREGEDDDDDDDEEEQVWPCCVDLFIYIQLSFLSVSPCADVSKSGWKDLELGEPAG